MEVFVFIAREMFVSQVVVVGQKVIWMMTTPSSRKSRCRVHWPVGPRASNITPTDPTTTPYLLLLYTLELCL